MSSKSTLYRRELKERDPEKYGVYLKKQREAAAQRKAEKEREWEEGQHTRAQIEAHNAQIEAKR